MDQNKNVTNGNIVNSVIKALHILECLTPGKSELSLAQISRHLSIPKSTTLNLIKTLESEGYLLRTVGQKYQLGYKLMELSYNLQISLPIIQYVTPFLEEIQIKTGEIIYLTSHIDGRVLYLEGMYPSVRIGNYSIAGRILPIIHCTGCGKAMMAYLPQNEIDDIIAKWGLPALTPDTITDPVALAKDLSETRKRGYAIDREEESRGVKCIGMPIRDADGYPTGAISISGTPISMRDDLLEEYAKILSRVSNTLGAYADKLPAAQIRLAASSPHLQE